MTGDHWLFVATLAGVITYGLRVCFIALIDVIELPGAVQAGLRFVPVAVFAALVAPQLLIDDQGAIDAGVDNLSLWAALVAAGIAWKTRSVLVTVIAGMLTLWALIFLTHL